MSDAQQAEVTVAPSRKRLYEFLSECAEVKKQKRDVEPALVKKRAEFWRTTDQIAKLKQQIMEKTRRLKAKEVIADGLNAELATLITEWNSSTD
jgi:chromosome segregation ATPase